MSKRIHISICLKEPLRKENRVLYTWSICKRRGVNILIFPTAWVIWNPRMLSTSCVAQTRSPSMRSTHSPTDTASERDFRSCSLGVKTRVWRSSSWISEVAPGESTEEKRLWYLRWSLGRWQITANSGRKVEMTSSSDFSLLDLEWMKRKFWMIRCYITYNSTTAVHHSDI